MPSSACKNRTREGRRGPPCRYGYGLIMHRDGTPGQGGGYSFFNDPATTEIYALSLHDALPIWLLFGERTKKGRRGGNLGGQKETEWLGFSLSPNSGASLPPPWWRRPSSPPS